MDCSTTRQLGLSPAVTKPDVLEGTSTDVSTTNKAVDALQRFTPPSQECLQSRYAPNAGSKNAVGRNVRRRLLSTKSIRPVNPSITLTGSQNADARNVRRHFLIVESARHVNESIKVTGVRLDEGGLNLEIVQSLVHILDEHNGLVRFFRTTRDRCRAGDVPGFKIMLYNMGDIRGYELPTSDYLSGLYDVVGRGDREGIVAGSKIMLPNTFTGRP
nr:helitron helicase-like domain-containing protein [Tanacetum cinerariifolium]